jgi:hypothetical protein
MEAFGRNVVGLLAWRLRVNIERNPLSVTPGFKIKNQMLIVCMPRNNLSYIGSEI